MFSVLSYEVEISTSSCGYAEICTYETQYDEGHRHTSQTQSGQPFKMCWAHSQKCPHSQQHWTWPRRFSGFPFRKVMGDEQTCISYHPSKRKLFLVQMVYELSGRINCPLEHRGRNRVVTKCPERWPSRQLSSGVEAAFKVTLVAKRRQTNFAEKWGRWCHW